MNRNTHRRRLRRLAKTLRSKRLDAMLVWDRANTRYLTGFQGSASLICLTPETGYFATDFRYLTLAKATIAHLHVIESKEGYLRKILKRHRAKRVGFEGAVPYQLYKTWLDSPDGIQLVESTELISRMRERKSREEVDRIIAAQRIAEKALQGILPHCRPGMTEVELARRLVRAIEDQGAQGVAFDPIVASGPNAALPHAKPGRRRLRNGDLVILDLGAVVDGYCSDMTRTVVVGRAGERQRHIHRLVLEAQRRAIARVRPGVAAKAVDRAAHGWIEKNGYGRKFGHGTGHGVGLEVHEPPSLKATSTDTLRRGMVVTIEPGIYVPGWGGVRIEDMVQVTGNGRRVLGCFTRRLIECPCDP